MKIEKHINISINCMAWLGCNLGSIPYNLMNTDSNLGTEADLDLNSVGLGSS